MRSNTKKWNRNLHIYKGNSTELKLIETIDIQERNAMFLAAKMIISYAECAAATVDDSDDG